MMCRPLMGCAKQARPDRSAGLRQSGALCLCSLPDRAECGLATTLSLKLDTLLTGQLLPGPLPHR